MIEPTLEEHYAAVDSYGDITCECRNTVNGDGFSPCGSDGIPCEPTKENWKDPHYVCCCCGRIVHVGNDYPNIGLAKITGLVSLETACQELKP